MKKILLKILSLPLIKEVFDYYWHYATREKKKKYGNENKDKVFYVIGQKERTGGLWWIVNKVVMHLAYADDKGYIPVVDYKNFWTQYHNDDELNKVNVWEKFFLQPAGYTLDDIKHSANIIISDQYSSPSEKYFMGNTSFYDDPSRLEYFRFIFRKYIRFSESTHIFLETEKEKILPEGQRVLGVLCRGTDYLLNKPQGHPIQPDPHEVIERAEYVMRDYKLDFIFLATEDEDILSLFKKHFNGKLLFVAQNRVSRAQMEGKKLVVEVNRSMNVDRYKMGLNYLLSTYILSNCTAFIGGRTGGTKGVLLMNNGFEYQHIYNLGFY